MTDNDHPIILEDINSKLDVILEGQAAMGTVPTDISAMKNDIAEIKEDVKTIEAAIKDLSKDEKIQTSQIEDHESRISELEPAA